MDYFNQPLKKNIYLFCKNADPQCFTDFFVLKNKKLFLKIITHQTQKLSSTILLSYTWNPHCLNIEERSRSNLFKRDVLAKQPTIQPVNDLISPYLDLLPLL